MFYMLSWSKAPPAIIDFFLLVFFQELPVSPLQNPSTDTGQVYTWSSLLQRIRLLNNSWVEAIITGLILMLVGWLLSLLWRGYRNRVRCRYLKNTVSDKEKFTRFYFNNVEEIDRISPDKITKWLGNSSYSAFSDGDMKRKWISGTTPIHILIVAESAGEIVGFCKSIALKESKSIYVGYLVVKNTDSQKPITNHLIKKLQGFVEDVPGVDYLIFEISGDSQRAQSRWRLFFDLASQHQLRLWRLPEYWIPVEDETDLTTPFDKPRWPGFLGIIPLRTIDRAIHYEGFEAGRFVLDMYFNIYLYMAREITDVRCEYDSYLARLYSEWYEVYGEGVELRTGRFLDSAGISTSTSLATVEKQVSEFTDEGR